jgi:hypothetical protein
VDWRTTSNGVVVVDYEPDCPAQGHAETEAS